jgi:hypothetical protein
MPGTDRPHLHYRHTVAQNVDLLAGTDAIDNGREFPGNLRSAQTRHGFTLSDKSESDGEQNFLSATIWVWRNWRMSG